MKGKLLFVFILLLVFSFSVRIFRLGEPKGYYFDEVYHVVTARAYSQNNPAAYDPFAQAPEKDTAFDWLHPPLAKLIQAASIKIIGDNPIGWRLPSAIFGTAVVGATFLLAMVTFGPTVAIFAAAVIALENLTFVMSRITMNDVFVTFFILMSFIFAQLFVARRRFLYLFLTCIFLGLSIASKWTGFWAIAAVFSYIFFASFGAKKLHFNLLLLLLIPPLLYIASYTQFFLQGYTFLTGSDLAAFFHNIRYDFAKVINPDTSLVKKSYESDFAKLHQQIWWYQNRHDLEHSYGTTPLYCVPKGTDGPKTWCPWILDSRGVYFSYEQYGERAGYIYALGNPLIFWSGILAVSFLVGKYFEVRRKEYLLVLLGFFIFWAPWIFTPRLLFLYHYLPSIPFLAISLGVVLASLWKTKFKYLALLALLLFAVTFFYFYPITSGWPIRPEAIEKYMWLSTWR